MTAWQCSFSWLSIYFMHPEKNSAFPKKAKGKTEDGP